MAFRAVGRYGSWRPYASGSLAITMTGPGSLAGETQFPFEATGGAGAIWVRSLPGKAGTITVDLAHPSLGTATVTIASRLPASHDVAPRASGPPYRSFAMADPQAAVLPG